MNRIKAMKVPAKWLAVCMCMCVAALGTGCVSMDKGKFEEQVHKWAPMGMPEAKAEKVMMHHSFDCDLVKQSNRFNQLGYDYMDCSRTQVWFHDWNVRILLKDGFVSGYTNVTVE
jgi:hypothetical protein